VEVSRLLIDTSAYIALLLNHGPVKEALRRADGVFVNPTVLGELRAGFLKGSKTQRNERLLADFLDSPRVQTVVIDDETSERYALIYDFLRRSGRPIPVNDIWIAASAAQHGLRLVTTDGHFKEIPQVLVELLEPPAAR
jgi:tRNA(fMet)-specific endonuclease VapC